MSVAASLPDWGAKSKWPLPPTGNPGDLSGTPDGTLDFPIPSGATALTAKYGPAEITHPEGSEAAKVEPLPSVSRPTPSSPQAIKDDVRTYLRAMEQIESQDALVPVGQIPPPPIDVELMPDEEKAKERILRKNFIMAIRNIFERANLLLDRVAQGSDGSALGRLLFLKDRVEHFIFVFETGNVTFPDFVLENIASIPNNSEERQLIFKGLLPAAYNASKRLPISGDLLPPLQILLTDLDRLAEQAQPNSN